MEASLAEPRMVLVGGFMFMEQEDGTVLVEGLETYATAQEGFEAGVLAAARYMEIQQLKGNA